MNANDPGDEAANTGFPNGYALVVAAAAYPQAPLPAAVINDAREIAAVLTSPTHCGYAPEKVRLLLDAEATLGALRRELATLAFRAKPGDTVIIYFSGHGTQLGDPTDPESALIPIDYDPAKGASSLLSEPELSAAFARIAAERLVVFLDACHSGGAGSFKAAGDIHHPSLGFSEKSLGRLSSGVGRALIASSRASETSLVLEGASNSLFTQHLLDALRGGARHDPDGFLRIFEIFSYVSSKVREAAPGRQHPIFKVSDLEDNFAVALAQGGVKRSRGIAQARSFSWDLLNDILPDLYPGGPQDQEIWTRAGGDLSLLRLVGSGRANWFAALRTLSRGGGGEGITHDKLAKAALGDYPLHAGLLELLSSESLLR